MTCKTHPTYQGKRMPRVNCRDCWRIYEDVKNGKDGKPETQEKGR